MYRHLCLLLKVQLVHTLFEFDLKVLHLLPMNYRKKLELQQNDYEGQLSYKYKYNNLQYKLIPAIENEIKIIETQGKFISNAKEDLKKLKESYSEVKELIA